MTDEAFVQTLVGEEMTQYEADAILETIKRLKGENKALRERLEKALKLREPRITVDHWGGLYEVVYQKFMTHVRKLKPALQS